MGGRNSDSVFYMLSETVGTISAKDVIESSIEPIGGNINRGLRLNIELQTAEVRNNNKRIYSKKSLVDGMRNAEKHINRGHMLQESGHPITEDTRRFNTIEMRNSVSRVNNYHFKGNKLYGEIETLNTSLGRDFRGMLLQEGFLGATSLRARGTVDKRTNRVSDKIQIITYDMVLNPSHETAVVQNIITESDIMSLIAESENLDIVRTRLEKSLGYLPTLLEEDTDMNAYNPDENSVILCTDGSCMKLFLEESFRDTYRDISGSYQIL